MKMSIVAAVSSNNVIGLENDMPWHLPADLKHFKDLTTGSTVIMGRRTFDSIGRALPGRVTIVVTRDKAWKYDGVQVAHSPDEAVEIARLDTRDIFIAGGGELYRQLWEQVLYLEITHINMTCHGDTTLPEILDSEWRAVLRSEHDGYSFVSYERNSVATGSHLAIDA